MNFFPYNSRAVRKPWRVFMERNGRLGETLLRGSLLLELEEDWIPKNLYSNNKRKENGVTLWVRDAVCPGWTSCFRYRVSPAKSHAGSESHLFTSRLQAADTSSPRVTGCEGDQISLWNFNLQQLNYLISEPPTSKEYLRSLLSGCLDGGFQYCVLEDIPILQGCHGARSAELLQIKDVLQK